MENDRLIIFVKEPVAGRVKTRLAAGLDPATARDLYRCFVEDIIATAERVGVPVVVAHDPPGSNDAIAAWLGAGRRYLPQHGPDLGARMRAAFEATFAAGYGKVVIVGSDLPDLPAAFIIEAFRMLETAGAVIGPSGDGGYYLIGFRQDTVIPAVFEGIPWSTPDVLTNTMEAFVRAHATVHQLPVWHDIDRPADLLTLIERDKNGNRAGARTMAFIREYRVEERLRSG
jgi:rSAM/selenodomain-associated transferase 1